MNLKLLASMNSSLHVEVKLLAWGFLVHIGFLLFLQPTHRWIHLSDFETSQDSDSFRLLHHFAFREAVAALSTNSNYPPQRHLVDLDT